MGNAPLISERSYEETRDHLFIDHSDLDNLYVLFHHYCNAAGPDDLPPKKPVARSAATVPAETTGLDPNIWKCKGSHMKLLTMPQFLCLPAVRANPFAPRLFAAAMDTDDGMTFEAFVLLASCLHPRAPVSVKSAIMYRVFDFNCSGYIEESDAKTALEIMTGLEDPWAWAREANAAAGSSAAHNTLPWRDEDFPSMVTKKHGGFDFTVAHECARLLGKEVAAADVEKALGRGGGAKEGGVDDNAEGPPKTSDRKKRSIARAEALEPELKEMVDRVSNRMFACLDADKSRFVTCREFEKVCALCPLVSTPTVSPLPPFPPPPSHCCTNTVGPEDSPPCYKNGDSLRVDTCKRSSNFPPTPSHRLLPPLQARKGGV